MHVVQFLPSFLRVVHIKIVKARLAHSLRGWCLRGAGSLISLPHFEFVCFSNPAAPINLINPYDPSFIFPTMWLTTSRLALLIPSIVSHPAGIVFANYTQDTN
jgi:hypothetical protein